MTDVFQQRLGTAFWAIVLIVVLIVSSGEWRATETAGLAGPSQRKNSTSAVVVKSSPAKLIFESLWTTTTPFEILDPTGVVRIGDVVFARADKPAEGSDVGAQAEEVREVGYITAVRRVDGSANVLTVTMFDPDAWSPEARFTVHRNSGRLGDVLATLMPPEKQAALHAKLTLAFETHAEAVAREILPLVTQSMRASLPLIESAMKESVERHDAEIQALIARYREEVVKEKLLPIVKQEIMPIVRKHGQDPAESIGREIWDRASLFRFGWRAIYDKSPLPERELLSQEWQRFVDEEVIPIVESHLDEIAIAVERMLQDIAANDRLREQFSDVVSTIASDPQAHQLFRQILNESIVENDRLRAVWTGVWTSPQAQARLRRAGQRIEPVLRELGDELMGTRQTGIEPGFARVLRNQILSKDRTWIMITLRPESPESHSPGELPILRPAIGFTPYPLIHVVEN